MVLYTQKFCSSPFGWCCFVCEFYSIFIRYFSRGCLISRVVGVIVFQFSSIPLPLRSTLCCAKCVCTFLNDSYPGMLIFECLSISSGFPFIQFTFYWFCLTDECLLCCSLQCKSNVSTNMCMAYQIGFRTEINEAYLYRDRWIEAHVSNSVLLSLLRFSVFHGLKSYCYCIEIGANMHLFASQISKLNTLISFQWINRT